MQRRLTNFRWQAIVNNQCESDGEFWYGVQTTKIFCKPSCPSKVPNRQNVEIFLTIQEALAAGFRPCKRCRPTGTRVSEYDWYEQTLHYLEHHYAENLTAPKIAQAMHGSESYLRQVFKRQAQQTPWQALLDIRLSRAEELLRTTNYSINLVAQKIGISNQTYFITKFKQAYKKTPKQWQILHYSV